MRTVVLPVVVVLTGSSACVGAIPAGSGMREPQPMAPGRVADPPAPPRGGTAAPAVSCALTPSAGALRRLTNVERANSLRDLFGERALVALDGPGDPRLHGFDNNRSTLTLSTAHLQSYGAQADAIAARVLADPQRAAVLGCEPTTGAACLDRVIDGVGRRAFRRPVTAEEKAALGALAKAADGDPDPLAPFRLVLSGILQNPSFLYRTELGVADAGRTGWKRLTGHELAARLSFSLWGTAPTVALLDAADRKELDTPAGVAATARAMLDDPRARQGLERFYAQLLKLHELADVQRDPTGFPSWTPRLRDAMAEETRRVAADLVWRDGASFLDLLTSRHSFVDRGLAQLYGIAAPASDWARVELTGDQRGGLMTHASVLTLAAGTDVTAPILRGAYVREVVLCNPPPPPPPGVPPAPESSEGKSVRELLGAHAMGGCAGCHGQLDPIGFGLERYDLIGRYRERDPQGRPLTGAGSVAGAPAPEFTGGVELGRKLRELPEASGCLAKHVLRYTLGRDETAGDGCGVSVIEAALRQTNHDLRAALPLVASSDLFRYVGGAP